MLFLPSFDPECVVTVSLDDEQPTVTLVTGQTNLWYWWCDQLDRTRGKVSDAPTPPAPERWQERAEIPAGHAETYRSQLRAISPGSVVVTERSLGLDGLAVVCQYRSREGVANAFEDRFGGNERVGDFVVALYELATALLHDERTVRTLERLHMYMGLGLPVKLVTGPPFTVRVFGALTSDDEVDLRDALRQVPVDAPVLMDFSNYDDVVRLVPVFREFLQRAERTVWWATGETRQQLEALGVPLSSLYETRAEAMATLDGRA